MVADLVRRVENTLTTGDPCVTRMPPSGIGRVDMYGGGVFILSDNVVNKYDGVAGRINDALCADPQIMGVTCDSEEKFSHRSHTKRGSNGRVIFNLAATGYQHLIYFILDYKEGSIPTGEGQELLLPTKFTLGVKLSNRKRIDGGDLTGAFRDVVEEADLPTVAVREAKRILRHHGYL